MFQIAKRLLSGEDRAAAISELRQRGRRARPTVFSGLGGESVFRVVVDGELVDSASHTDSSEDDWVTRSVPLPDRGERRATLELTVTASSNMNYFPSAEAWVDDLRIA